MPVTPVLRAEAVNTWLDDTHVLHDVSLTIDPGEVVALLGGNGSGKTTLLRTLLGLVPHASGEISLFGTPLSGFREWPRVGYVPQRTRLQVPSATVKEIVMLGRLSRRSLFRPSTQRDEKAVSQALERVGMSGSEAHPMAHLSGGQQQRVLIARALVGHADLLILDEPLAALDVRTQVSLARLLGQLHDQGVTILTVLHELGAMESMLTRGVVLQNGRIIHDGPLRSGPPTDDCASVDLALEEPIRALGLDPRGLVG